MLGSKPREMLRRILSYFAEDASKWFVFAPPYFVQHAQYPDCAKVAEKRPNLAVRPWSTEYG